MRLSVTNNIIMKQQIKNGFLTWLIASLTIFWFWVIYAAWDDTVTSWDPLSAVSWNELVNRIKVFNIDWDNIGIWAATPENALHISKASTQAWILQENTDGTQWWQYPSITQYAYNAWHPALIWWRSSWTKSQPWVAPVNVTLQTIVWRAHDASDFKEVWRISIKTGDSFSDTDIDWKIELQVRKNNVANTAMVIQSDWNVWVWKSNPEFILDTDSDKWPIRVQQFWHQGTITTLWIPSHDELGILLYYASDENFAWIWSTTWWHIQYTWRAHIFRPYSDTTSATDDKSFFMLSSGRFGIWTRTPWSKLSVVWLPSWTSWSNAWLDGSSSWAVCIMSDGDMYVDIDWVCN